MTKLYGSLTTTEFAVPTHPPKPEPVLDAEPCISTEPFVAQAIRLDDAEEIWGVDLPLSNLVKDAIVFPWRGDGWGMVIIGAFVVFCVFISGVIPILGFVVQICGIGYLSAYYFDVIQHTIAGRRDVPAWPDFSDYWDDLVIPGLQMIGVILISSTPLLVLNGVGLNTATSSITIGDVFAWSFYWLYFPIATLSVACKGTVVAVLPHIVVPSLRRVLPGYLICVAVFALAEIGRDLLSSLLSAVPILGGLTSLFFFMACMLVQARLIGLIYLRYRSRFQW